MKTYSEVIQQLIDINDKLIQGKITVEKAKQVCNNTQVVINAAKLQLEVLKYKKQTESVFFEDTKDTTEKKKLSTPGYYDNSPLVIKTKITDLPAYKDNCNGCAFFVNIVSANPPTVTCNKSGEEKEVLLRFAKCEWI